MDSAVARLPSLSPGVGDLIGGKYRVLEPLGTGRMGSVFLAENELTKRRVAIKWLKSERTDPASAQRVLREARSTASINHRHVVSVFDVAEHDGVLFMVMEYVPGKSLRDVFHERGPIPPAELVDWLMPAMEGVQAAHDAGVIHRDLKPENIVLSELDGNACAKVVDFGVCKVTSKFGPKIVSLTNAGDLLGTPHYMAMEQVDGGEIGPWTDVYAFGVILYRGLTGQLPFTGGNVWEIVLQVGTHDPIRPASLCPEIPQELEAVVLRAMAREPKQRFSSLKELVEALVPFGTFAPTWPTLPSVDMPLPPIEQGASAPKDAPASRRNVLYGLFGGFLLASALHVWWSDRVDQVEAANRPRPPSEVRAPVRSTSAQASIDSAAIRAAPYEGLVDETTLRPSER